MTYFSSIIDYIFFFYGLSFLGLAAVCFFLMKEADEPPAWSWLGLFGLLHGLNEWLDLLAFTFSDGFVFSALRTLLMSLSFLSLFEFGRRSLKNSGAALPGAWSCVPLLLPAGLGWYYGLDGANSAARYALGLPAGLLAALAVYRAAAGQPAGRRGLLQAISAGLALYALASGAVVPESALIPTRWLNYESFARVFGFPVQLLRAVLALFISLNAWGYLLELSVDKDSFLKNRRKVLVGWSVIAAILASIAVGWGVTDAFGRRANKDLVRDSENMETILANRVSSSLWMTEQAVVSMSGAPWIQGALAAGDPGSVNKGETVLERYCTAFDFSVCYLINLKGVTIASTNRNSPNSFIGKDYSFRPYFTAAAAGGHGSYFALGVTSGERGYYASYPVKTEGGKLVGVAVIKKSLGFMAQELRLFSYAFLVSPEGVIFVSSQPDLLFKTLWPTGSAARESLTRTKQFGSINFEPLLKAELRDEEILRFAGDIFYISRAHLKQPGWSLATFNSLRPVRMARLAGILITFVLCMLLLAFFITLIQSETARETAEKLLALKAEVKTLTGILPICAGCKKIRDEAGGWSKVETYVARHTDAQFSHGLCPDCVKRLYPEYSDDEPGPAGGKP